MTLALKTLADLAIGSAATHNTVVDRDVVERYADLSGDRNPVHLDEAYARGTRFGVPIAHGLLVAGYVQTALTELVAPGGVSTSYAFRLVRPVPVGSAVTARVECTQIDEEHRRATFTVSVTVAGGAEVITGEAQIAFPSAHEMEPK